MSSFIYEEIDYLKTTPLDRQKMYIVPTSYLDLLNYKLPPGNNKGASKYKYSLKDIFLEMPNGISGFQQSEWVKCKYDFLHFAKRYAHIEIKDTSGEGSGRMSRFHPWPKQIELMKSFLVDRLHIILKARQLGISWLSGLFGLWRFNFHCHEHILIESKKENDAKDLLTKIKMAYDVLPVWMKAPLSIDSTTIKHTSVQFEDSAGNKVDGGLNSRIEAIATGGGASKTVTVNIRDEAALVDNQTALMTHKSTMPTLTTTGGWCFIISTAEGAYGFFHDLYWKAKSGVVNFKAHFLPYQTRPDRTEEWYENEKKNFSNEDDFKNQYPRTDREAFLVSGRTAFSKKALNLLLLDKFEKPRFRDPIKFRINATIEEIKDYKDFIPQIYRDPDGMLEVWEIAEQDKTYVMGMDVAEGKLVNHGAKAEERGDYSCACVVCRETNEYVARIKTRSLGPDEYGRECAKLARYYNNALAIPEINSGYGYVLLNTLLKFHDNIYYRETPVDKFAGGITKEYGFLTSKKTRGLLVSSLGTLIKDSPFEPEDKTYPQVPSFILHGKDTVTELSQFIITDKGKAEAASGAHDDEVMALGLCSVVLMSDKWSGHDFITVNEPEQKPVTYEEQIVAFETKRRWDRVNKRINPNNYGKRGINPKQVRLGSILL